MSDIDIEKGNERFLIRRTETSDLPMANRIADRMLKDKNGRHKYNLSVICKTPDFPYTKVRNKSRYGVSFPFKEREQAKAWIIDVLLKGHIVFRDGGGTSLKSGDSWDDIWDYKEARGICECQKVKS